MNLPLQEEGSIQNKKIFRKPLDNFYCILNIKSYDNKLL